MAVVAIKFHVRFDGVAKDERVQYLASVWLYRLVSSVIRNKNCECIIPWPCRSHQIEKYGRKPIFG